MDKDKDQLRLLSILNYVWAGVIFLIGLVVAFGLSFLTAIPDTNKVALLLPALLTFLLIGTIAFLYFLSGRFLARQKNYWYSFVIACIECLSFPIGTALGVFTIIVLLRPSVKELYGIK